uniref:Uncharacterized protein n=1 Tax=Pseudomonas phage HRDY3 TaxID=3236930 RepID=A0AB39CDK7_9VIRU
MNNLKTDGYELPTLEEIGREMIAQIIWHKREDPRAKLSGAVRHSAPLHNQEPYVVVEMQSDNYHSFDFTIYLNWKGEQLELTHGGRSGSLGGFCKGYADGFVLCFNAVPPDPMKDALKKFEAKRAEPHPN